MINLLEAIYSLDKSDWTTSAKILAPYLAFRAGGWDGLAFAGPETIMAETGLSKPSFHRARNELISKGIITRAKVRGRWGYKFDPERVSQGDRGVSHGDSKVSQGDREVSQGDQNSPEQPTNSPEHRPPSGARLQGVTRMRKPEKPVDEWSPAILAEYFSTDCMRRAARDHGVLPVGGVDQRRLIRQIRDTMAKYDLSPATMKAMMDRYVSLAGTWPTGHHPATAFFWADNVYALRNKVEEGTVTDDGPTYEGYKGHGNLYPNLGARLLMDD